MRAGEGRPKVAGWLWAAVLAVDRLRDEAGPGGVTTNLDVTRPPA
jgi:hypothetical protein